MPVGSKHMDAQTGIRAFCPPISKAAPEPLKAKGKEETSANRVSFDGRTTLTGRSKRWVDSASRVPMALRRSKWGPYSTTRVALTTIQQPRGEPFVELVEYLWR